MRENGQQEWVIIQFMTCQQGILSAIITHDDSNLLEEHIINKQPP